MNAQQYSSGGATFTYVASATVSSVWPARGAAEGGTPVTVYGANLLAASEQLGYLHCRFNGTLVRAARESDEAVVCNSSAATAGVATTASAVPNWQKAPRVSASSKLAPRTSPSVPPDTGPLRG